MVTTMFLTILFLVFLFIFISNIYSKINGIKNIFNIFNNRQNIVEDTTYVIKEMKSRFEKAKKGEKIDYD